MAMNYDDFCFKRPQPPGLKIKPKTSGTLSRDKDFSL